MQVQKELEMQVQVKMEKVQVLLPESIQTDNPLGLPGLLGLGVEEEGGVPHHPLPTPQAQPHQEPAQVQVQVQVQNFFNLAEPAVRKTKTRSFKARPAEADQLAWDRDNALAPVFVSLVCVSTRRPCSASMAPTCGRRRSCRRR